MNNLKDPLFIFGIFIFIKDSFNLLHQLFIFWNKLNSLNILLYNSVFIKFVFILFSSKNSLLIKLIPFSGIYKSLLIALLIKKQQFFFDNRSLIILLFSSLFKFNTMSFFISIKLVLISLLLLFLEL